MCWWRESVSTNISVVKSTLGNLSTTWLRVCRGVSQALDSAVAQLLVNYLAQQAGTLSALRAKEEDKLTRRFAGCACLADDWGYCGTFVTYLWGLRPEWRRRARPHHHSSCSYLAPARRECWMFGDHGSLPDTLVKKWSWWFTQGCARLLQSASAIQNHSLANLKFISQKMLSFR